MNAARRVVLEGEGPPNREAQDPNSAIIAGTATAPPIHIRLWGDSHLQQNHDVPPSIDAFIIARRDLYRYQAPSLVTEPRRRRFDDDLTARLTLAFKIDYPTLHVLLVGSNDLRDEFYSKTGNGRKKALDRVTSLVQQHEHVANLVDQTRCHSLLIVSPLPSTHLAMEPIFEKYAEELRELCDRHPKVKYAPFRELNFPESEMGRDISGRKDFFKDVVHLSSKGATELARSICANMERIPARQFGLLSNQELKKLRAAAKAASTEGQR